MHLDELAGAADFRFTFRRAICATCTRTWESRNCLKPEGVHRQIVNPGRGTSSGISPFAFGRLFLFTAPVAWFCKPDLQFRDGATEGIPHQPEQAAVSVCADSMPMRSKGDEEQTGEQRRLSGKVWFSHEKVNRFHLKTLGLNDPISIQLR